MKNLLDLKIHEEAQLAVIDHPDAQMKRRLLDLGFCQGTVVKRVLNSPKEDPIAYKVRGTVIALRRCDAQYLYLLDDSMVNNEYDEEAI